MLSKNSVFENSTPNEEDCAKALQAAGYPFEPILSMDSRDCCEVITMYNAMKFYHGYLHDTKQVALLDKACDLNFYSALYRRIKNNLGDDQLNYKQLQSDMEKIAYWWWSPGCMDTQDALFSLGNKMLKSTLKVITLDELKRQNMSRGSNTEEEPAFLTCWRDSAMYYDIAIKFKDNPMSLMLKEIIAPKEKPYGTNGASVKSMSNLLTSLGVSAECFFEQAEKKARDKLEKYGYQEQKMDGTDMTK